VRGLLAWNHRLRLFYYFAEPASPLSLLLRPVLGPLYAPFRSRDRTEVRLYVKLGMFFVLAFLLLDIIEHVLSPVATGDSPAGLGSLIRILMTEAAITFFVSYAFAGPIGAVLTVQLLMRRTHTVPRVLCVVAVVAILVGMAL
jgi:hypothetical protein